MRTLNVAKLKNLMRTHECNLVHCHTNNLWTNSTKYLAEHSKMANEIDSRLRELLLTKTSEEPVKEPATAK